MKNHYHYEQEALAAFSVADDAWNDELVHAYGAKACDMRYCSLGKGPEGSILRRIYDYRAKCFATWQSHKQAVLFQQCSAEVQS